MEVILFFIDIKHAIIAFSSRILSFIGQYQVQ